MIMTVVQPAYFMDIRALAKVALCDIVVWADTFPFKSGTTINRTQIKTAEGGRWLTIPVLQKGKGPQEIRHGEIDNHEPWLNQHWKNIENNYKNSPYFYYFEEKMVGFVSRTWQLLNDLLWDTFIFLVDSLFTGKKVLAASELPQVANRSRRVLEWATATGADSYLLEQQEIDLIDSRLIIHEGLSLLTYHEKEISYHQQFSGFIPGLSGLDVLFNEGEMSSYIIRKSARLLPIDEAKNESF